MTEGLKTPLEIIEELENIERLRWALRLRRRALAGLVTVYAIGVLLKLIPATLTAVAFLITFFIYNEYRRYLFRRGRLEPPTFRSLALEVLGINLFVYASGGVESFWTPLAMIEVVAVSIHVNYATGWRVAYLALSFFAASNLLELAGILPHAPMVLWDATGRPVPFARTDLAARGFPYLVLICTLYGFLLSITAYASGYINNKLKIRENLLELAHQMLASIYRLSTDLLTRVELPAVVEVMAEWIVEELGISRVMVVALDDAGRPVVATYPRALFTEAEVDALSRGLKDPRQVRDAGWEWVDLQAGPKTMGMVLLPPGSTLKPEERSILDTALNHFKTTIERSRYVAEALALSVTDGMTQIPNRRHFTQSLGREIARANRHKQPLTLLLIDVDHFKRVNDVHGHLCGDMVLCEVARILTLSTRETDMVARYGGEEFAVLAPQTDLESARVVAERIRERVARHAFVSNGTRLTVTVSLGLGELFLDQAQGGDDLIAIADRRLYIAKNQGRDRTIAQG